MSQRTYVRSLPYLSLQTNVQPELLIDSTAHNWGIIDFVFCFNITSTEVKDATSIYVYYWLDSINIDKFWFYQHISKSLSYLSAHHCWQVLKKEGVQGNYPVSVHSYSVHVLLLRERSFSWLSELDFSNNWWSSARLRLRCQSWELIKWGSHA